MLGMGYLQLNDAGTAFGPNLKRRCPSPVSLGEMRRLDLPVSGFLLQAQIEERKK